MSSNLSLGLQVESNIELEKSDRLLRTFEEIHNHIYANDGLSSQQVFEEMIKILFIKVFDEREKTKAFYITKDELDSSIEGKKVIEFEKRIKDLFDKSAAYFNDVFEDKDKINIKGSSLAFVVGKLQSLNLSDSSRDIKGLAFQKFIYSKQRSDRGQFFTPEQIIDLCVKILKPTKDDKILDPACGSAGFISQAMNFVFDYSLAKASEGERKKFAKHNVYGIEINKTAAKTAKMRMLLDGDGYSNISVLDSLSDWDKINSELGKESAGFSSFEEYFDIILTNPPFGSQGKVTDKSALRRFNLAHKWARIGDKFIKSDQIQDGQVPDILFIERCLDFLKDGGRLAIVLPNGDLENSSLQYLRQYIVDRAEILAIIKLPSDTFIPFGTGVKASVLFLRKCKNIKRLNDDILLANVNKIGYQGNKNGTVVYKKDSYGNLILVNGNPVIDEDISDIINSYGSKTSGEVKENCFMISPDQLGSRFDVDFYDPEMMKLEKKLLKNNAVRLSELVEIKKNKSSRLKNKDEVVEYVELSDLSSEYSEIVNSTQMAVHDLPSRAQYELDEGDVITAVAGNSIGSKKHVSAIVSSKYKGAICTNGFRVMRTKSSVDSYYLLYFFRTEIFLNQVMKYRTGAAIPAISDDDFLNILVPVPKVDLQKEISLKVKKSIQLRDESKNIFETIRLESN